MCISADFTLTLLCPFLCAVIRELLWDGFVDQEDSISLSATPDLYLIPVTEISSLAS